MVNAARALQTLSGVWTGVSTFTLRRLHDPLAVCNDGSRAGYYFQKGNTSSRTWLIYLAGGNWCFDKSSCMERCPPRSVQPRFPGDALCTSRFYPKTMEFGGIMTPSDPESTLGRAHKAFVMYCSSDGHMGNGKAWGMEFRGARIVEAVFKDLVRSGLASGENELVILGGFSAGARGAMVMLDYVPEILVNAGARNASDTKVVGLLDSPLWVDVPPMVKSGFYGFRRSCRNVLKFANVTRLGEDCPTAFPKHQQFKCLMGEYRMKYVKTPYMLVASQYDSFQLMMNMGEPTDDPADEAYLYQFSNRTRGIVNALESQGGPQPKAFFTPSCFTHARSMLPEGWETEGIDVGDGKITTMGAAFDEFLQLAKTRSKAKSMWWKDHCEGIACGAGCPRPPSGAASLGRMLAFLLVLASIFMAIL